MYLLTPNQIEISRRIHDSFSIVIPTLGDDKDYRGSIVQANHLNQSLQMFLTGAIDGEDYLESVADDVYDMDRYVEEVLDNLLGTPWEE